MAFPSHDTFLAHATPRRSTFAPGGTARRTRMAAPAVSVTYDDESLFLCPDRDGTGFVPSGR